MVDLPEGDVSFFMEYSADKISAVMITRPIASEFMNKLIYDIMKCGNFVLYAPDGKFPIVLSPEVSDHLPFDLLEALGNPQIAENLAFFSNLLLEMYR